MRYRFTVGANVLDALDFIDPWFTGCIKHALRAACEPFQRARLIGLCGGMLTPPVFHLS